MILSSFAGFLFVASTCYLAATDVIHVAPNGFPSPDCWTGGEQRPCNSIQLALTGLQTRFNSTNTSVLVHGPNTYPFPANSSASVISGAQNVAITGLGSGVDIECSPGAGLVFINAFNVSLSQLTFRGCGKTEITTTLKQPKHRLALLFHTCRHVTINNVNISHSNGVGTLIHDTSGLVQIRQSVYTENAGSAQIGGGGIMIQVKSAGIIANYSIMGCLFQHNNASRDQLVYFDQLLQPYSQLPGKGGGLMVSIQQNNAHSSLVVDSCIFLGNTAQYGGGLYLQLDSGNTVVNITNCSFQNNSGHAGSAFFLATQEQLPSNVLPPCVQISAATFSQNMIVVHPNASTGSGAVYSEGVPICFSMAVLFTGNSGTAMVVSGTPFIISSSTSVIFIDNAGHDGGALALLNRAYLIVDSNSTLRFTSNTAHVHGGAIFSAHYGLQQNIYSGACFVQYINQSIHPNDWNVSFIFEDNHASNQENSIYTPSILSCVWPSDNSTDVYADIDAALCWRGWQFLPDHNCSNHISTAPAYFHLAGHQGYSWPLLISAFPGRTKQLPLEFFDDKSNDVTSSVVFRAFINGNDTFVNQYTDDSVTLFGKPGTTRTLVLDTLSPRVIQTAVNVSFMLCPPGFRTKNTTKGDSCECAGHFGGSVICDAESFHSFLRWGKIMSYNESSDQVLVGPWRDHTTPHDLGDHIPGYYQLPNDTLKLNEFICSKLNRQGFLCGECLNGTSSPVFTYDYMCVKCSPDDVRWTWLLFLVLEILPVTVFFLVVAIFNISATSGPLNAYIYFSQVLSSPAIAGEFIGQLNYVFLKTPWVPKLIFGIFVFPYGIWNLECFPVHILLPPFCVAENMNALQAFTLTYLIAALYPLLLIGFLYICIELHAHGFQLLVWMWKHFGYCLGRWRRNWDIRTSIIDAFAAFLLLAYTKFCFLSFYLLVPMNTYNNIGQPVGQSRLFFDPSIIFGSSKHIPFVLLSIFILVFVILLPPIFLLLYPLRAFQNLLSRCRVRGNALRTFVEAFQGCYKDGTNGTSDFRCFASIYFGLRIVAFSSMVFAYDSQIQRFIQVILMYLIVLLFSLARPYKEEWYNRLDVFIFTVLGIVATFGFYNAVISNNSLVINIALMMAMIIPQVYFILLVSHRVYFGLKRWWSRRDLSRRSTFNQSVREQEEEEEEKDEDDMLILELSTDSLPDRMVHPEAYERVSQGTKRMSTYGSMNRHIS